MDTFKNWNKINYKNIKMKIPEEKELPTIYCR